MKICNLTLTDIERIRDDALIALNKRAGRTRQDYTRHIRIDWDVLRELRFALSKFAREQYGLNVYSLNLHPEVVRKILKEKHLTHEFMREVLVDWA